jgi:pimeloyl-ACP methyl ester carboxylesterase
VATVQLEAGEFSYTEYGDRAAPPLVLLHGMPSDRSTWADVAPDFASEYRVISLDQRGHGASARYAIDGQWPNRPWGSS